MTTRIDLKQNAFHMQSQVSSKSGNMGSTFSCIFMTLLFIYGNFGIKETIWLLKEGDI